MVGILAGERGRRKGGLYHYMLGLERETRLELATLCSAGTPLAVQHPYPHYSPIVIAPLPLRLVGGVA